MKKNRKQLEADNVKLRKALQLALKFLSVLDFLAEFDAPQADIIYHLGDKLDKVWRATE